MNIFVFKEEKEKRIAVTEDIVEKLISEGHTIEFGEDIHTPENVDVVLSINPLPVRLIKQMKKGTVTIALQKPHIYIENIELFKEREITSFALDMMPRTTRAQYMDVLSSQASLSGYRAVVQAAYLLDRSIPMMMTTAGTISAAKFLVLGAGVAGLQAIATAKRLGAVVSAFDVRKAAKEQVESLGARFIEVLLNKREDTGSDNSIYAKETSEEYKKAQEKKIMDILPSQDVVIATAQIPFKKAPIIIKKGMLKLMKENSIIIDLASETGGNCEITEHGKVVTSENGVRVIAFENILWNIAYDASRLFAKNIYCFLKLLMEKQNGVKDLNLVEDEIIRGTLLTYKGKILQGY